MRLKTSIKPVGAMLFALVAGITTGCVDEAKLNTDTVTYTPEERPLGIIATEGAEYEPNSDVTISARLVGTVSGQTVLWTQTSGTAIEGVSDWTSTAITFTAPDVLGIETFEFEVKALNADGSEALNAADEPIVATTSITVFDPATKVFYEIEDESVATLTAVNAVSSGENYLSGASGSHTEDITPGASVSFSINAEEDKFVTLYAAFGIPSSGYGSKVAIVNINGIETEITVDATGNFSEYRVGVIKLNAGENIIEVGGGWNYYRLDYLMTVPAAQPPAPLAVAPTLVNANAQDSAITLMEYLTTNYGSSTLSGQTEYLVKDNQFGLTEFDKVVAATGDDAPAIVAFDYIDMSASRVSNGTDVTGITEAMIAQHEEKNVILSALWHWNAPMHLTDADGDGLGDESGSSEQAWWSGFYSKATTFDLAAALADKNSAEYTALLADIDTVSAELKKLHDAEIPVLWRPLHEAEGTWFWWGNAGAEALKELWIIMFDRMTNTHGLNNLIWVFTHAGELDSNWYPGDEYVDIVGYDGYAGANPDAPFGAQYATLKDRFNGKKLVALTETGTIPNVSLMHEQNAWWSFFITWNSSEQYGPDGIDNAIIDSNYAFDGVINLADIPGGRDKVEAGLWESFEVSTQNFEAQINWSPTSGISTSDKWKTSGSRALTLVKDLSAETEPTGAMFQVYPTGGIDVSDITTLKVSANAINAGAGTTVKLFVKHGDDWAWADSGAVEIVDGGIELEVDVSGFDWLAGLGFQYENIDAAATAAEFYLDNVRLDDTVIYDFEPNTSGWESQINWSGVPGLTVTQDWATSGSRALTIIKDLSQETDPTGVVFQAYPVGGIDVTDISTLKLSAHAVGAGAATTIKLFVKHGDDWAWADAGAIAISDNGLELEIDVSEYTWLAGLGLQIENIDATATDARFYLDNVRLEDRVIYDFEGTKSWEFQVSWAPTAGIQLSSDWSAEGKQALSASTANTADIVFQVYPAGGLLLGDVTTMKINVNALNAGADVNAHIFWKGEGEQSWPEAIPVTEGGVELSIDLTVGELEGFGVRFQAPNNSSEDAQFFIDNVRFE